MSDFFHTTLKITFDLKQNVDFKEGPNLISELQFLSGEVQLGPSLAGEVDVDDLVAVPADLKLLVGPDVEVLPLLVDLADDAPDGQVVQVHLVPVVVLHRV